MADDKTVLVEMGKMQGDIKGLNDKLDAAHRRIDTLEQGISEDIKEIKDDLKPVVAYMNKSKGGMAAIVLGVTIFGGAVGALLSHWVKTPG